MSINLLSRAPSFDVLHYMDGITRKISNNKKFIYYHIKNNTHVSSKTLKRIKKLIIPPSWENVWISGDPQTPIQAVGTDKKGRKQYKYNQAHIKHSTEIKFKRLYEFIKSLPKLERALTKFDKLKPYDKNKVIVSMLKIVKELHMRVGKEVYARKNKSYGVSSLRKIHMKLDGNIIKFKFKGKSRRRLSYTLNDKSLANHLKLLLKLEGDKLFQYIDTNNKIRGITDVDLNKFIQQYMGKEFTVKDFRTYAANRFFIKAILSETTKRSPKNEKVIKLNINNALKTTAFYLKHTKAISKQSYVMEYVMDLYKNQPEYFVKRKHSDAEEVLIDVLKKYKKMV